MAVDGRRRRPSPPSPPRAGGRLPQRLLPLRPRRPRCPTAAPMSWSARWTKTTATWRPRSPRRRHHRVRAALDAELDLGRAARLLLGDRLRRRPPAPYTSQYIASRGSPAREWATHSIPRRAGGRSGARIGRDRRGKPNSRSSRPTSARPGCARSTEPPLAAGAVAGLGRPLPPRRPPMRAGGRPLRSAEHGRARARGQPRLGSLNPQGVSADGADRHLQEPRQPRRAPAPPTALQGKASSMCAGRRADAPSPACCRAGRRSPAWPGPRGDQQETGRPRQHRQLLVEPRGRRLGRRAPGLLEHPRARAAGAIYLREKPAGARERGQPAAGKGRLESRGDRSHRDASASEGAFAVGQTITAKASRRGRRSSRSKAARLTLSRPATIEQAHRLL